MANQPLDVYCNACRGHRDLYIRMCPKHSLTDRMIEALKKSARVVVQDDGWCLVCMKDVGTSPSNHDEDCPAWFCLDLLDEIKKASNIR